MIIIKLKFLKPVNLRIINEFKVCKKVSRFSFNHLVVVGGGLAGAILGLSTLSFVDEPKDHTDNIIVGASLGIIGGVVFVALSQATKTQDLLYGGEEYQEQASLNSIKSFDTKARTSWHSESFIASNSAKPRLNQISYIYIT